MREIESETDYRQHRLEGADRVKLAEELQLQLLAPGGSVSVEVAACSSALTRSRLIAVMLFSITSSAARRATVVGTRAAVVSARGAPVSAISGVWAIGARVGAGLSGPAIRPLALYRVWELARQLDCHPPLGASASRRLGVADELGEP